MKNKFKNKVLRLFALSLAAFLITGCTKVDNWGVTVVTVEGKPSAIYNTEDKPAIFFGDDKANVAEDISYAEWTYDTENLHTDLLVRSEFSGTTPVAIDEPIRVGGLNYELTFELVDPFEDSAGSGKKGIAVVYTIKNISSTTIYFGGIRENVIKFAMFAPNDTSLKTHYNLVVEPSPQDEYDGRISYPKDIYSPSMSTTELLPGESLTMYRSYDFMGLGEYHLYVCTDVRKDLKIESALLTITIT